MSSAAAAAALHLQALDGRVERVNLETHYWWKGFAETSEAEIPKFALVAFLSVKVLPDYAE